MSDEVLGTLVHGLGMAAFTRTREGSFVPAAPLPAWFARIASDTFPFLGHILEEATAFWQEHTPGSREFGPCAEVDGSGGEFHYKVTALTAGHRQYLVFQLDPGSDQVREILQKARTVALAREQNPQDPGPSATEIRLAREEINRALGRLLGTGPTDVQIELLRALSAKCDELIETVK